MSIKQEAIFIGANRQNQVSSYNKSLNIVAFGACNTIALWDPLDPSNHGVIQTLKGHEADVTCVKFIHGTPFMISASEDHHVKVWKVTDNVWNCVQTIQHYQNTIVALDVLEDLFVVGCADGNVSIWVRENELDTFVMSQEFIVQQGVLPLSFALSNVTDNKYLLAIGGTNVNVFIYSFVFSRTQGVDAIHDCKLAAKLEGHEDWIKSMAFRHQETPGDYLLCSGSQDRYIRLWRIRINDLIEEQDDENDENKLELLNNKQYKFHVADDLKVCINFEALIMGHDDWISSLQWHETRLQLLASTADTALMVWEPDEASGIWVCGLRLGELSSKGASTATGSAGGFWSCLWFSSEDNVDYILTNGRTGSWRIWKLTDNNQTCEQELGISGPIKEVTDIAWAPNGKYLLATSLDQTTRLFAPWLYNADKSKRSTITWHEFSRPQIHGYDMICVEPITNTRFISGGDEKILRSFDEPKGVAQILDKFTDIKLDTTAVMPETASVPVLGLSNKADNPDDSEDEDDDEVNHVGEEKNIATSELVEGMTTPPKEDQLQRHLLWPEIEKLYGHGYEITCVDVSPDGKFIASACRSNTPQHAVIRIFETGNWLEVKPVLEFHTLTITRLEFSHDNKYLLSVCRDRQWAVWERTADGKGFSLKYNNVKPHSRIIWDGDWVPTEFGTAFITGSRDRTIKMWNFDESKDDFILENSFKHTKPVTALSVYDYVVDKKILVAVGLETGEIFVYKYDSEDGFQLVHTLEDSITPAGKITRLRWSTADMDKRMLLGVSSNDSSARIYSIPKV
ncbi:Elongator subunit ELP2 NDAI_0D02250 [Naumovozyma dairenensis CBS 421]|uniref:Elongator complex protein 2 n=1 Tax=Naumovozyma dairenensis (strain ATCC 10597 / BCRC 20456 / CBS 421 / NBRC 0211 / NRRL Y-12639) TaxID=1071378 RepID=G0W9S8_NAUDC|nr:hypothetical protein NDAI_0D02250 [Naumovozyma dairenensis CBS 421]CCD24539.1 hypothetical protein NDAI_0D02250 [Naumovozyma dairenensis CBS 421]